MEIYFNVYWFYSVNHLDLIFAAYSLDEINGKMRSFCELTKYSASDGATVLDSYTEPYSDKLLPDLLPKEQDVFTLDLDLNETLVHYI
ncbi:hypothetical protein JHK82_049659 [Glycine max]|nr:hypothetical protein JHK86_049526 [Glycine max]KAG5090881.1 hypothetical protein JHK82_049659 [Glycine max]KAG5093969.1 hypothetical protein JHK84_049557 [Glycine max]